MRSVDMRAVIESIAKEILQSMNQKERPKQRVLFVFCDSTAHEAFHDQFIKLNNHRICHDLLFLDGETASWLGMNRLECGGAGRVIATDEYAPSPLEVPKEYDAILIPEIDLDNAARVAAGMKGTIKAELIFAALVLGKSVLIGSDVPGIKRADRRTLQSVELPGPYQRLFQQQMAALLELGVELHPQRSLADAVIRRLKSRRIEEATDGTEVEASEDGCVFDGKLLTVEWLQRQTHLPNKIIYLQADTLISPLAKDLLKEQGWHVRTTGSKGEG